MAHSHRSKSYNRISLSPLKFSINSLQKSTSNLKQRISSTPPHPFLHKLRVRNSIAPNGLEASQIIKKDLLPMIESYSRSSYLKRLSADYNSLGSSRANKLSELLNSKVTSTFSQLCMTQKAQTAAACQIYHALQEIEDLQDKLEESLKVRAFLRHKRDSFALKTHKNPDLHQWKDRSESMLKLTSSLSKKVFFERSLNCELRQKESQLKHLSCSLSMNNDVMGDQLKSLYEASKALWANLDIRELFIVPLIPIYRKSLVQKDNKLYSWNLVKSISLNTLSNAIDKIKEQKELLSSIKNAKLQIRDRIRLLDRKIKYLTNGLDSQKKIYENYNSKMEGLRALYSSTKAEYKKALGSQSIYKEEEKICKNCRAVFIDSENYNWSCKVHLSEWSGSVYWCCGNNMYDSRGCYKCKHVSTDEENLETNSIPFCSCCKKNGHTHIECPKDANVRNALDMEEELLRVSALKYHKKKVMRPVIVEIPENEDGDLAELNDYKNELDLESFFAKDNDNIPLPTNKLVLESSSAKDNNNISLPTNKAERERKSLMNIYNHN